MNNNNPDPNESVDNILDNLNEAIETYTGNSQKFREETISKLELISEKVKDIMKSKEQIDTNENKIQRLDSSDKEDASQIKKLQDENNRLKGGINKAIVDINNLNDADNGSNNAITGFINNISEKLDIKPTIGGYMYSERGRRKKNTSYKSSARGVLSNNGIENSIELYKTKGRKTKGHKSKGHKQKSRKLKAAGMLNVMRMKQTKYKKTKSKGKNKSKAKKSKSKSKQNKSKKNNSVKRR